MKTKPVPSLELRLRVLGAVEAAPGDTIRDRIKAVAQRSFKDEASGQDYQFTWRTISTWLYRYKKNGVTSMENKSRADKNGYRKVQPNELAEAIHDLAPKLGRRKNGTLIKSALYRQLLKQGYFCRKQLAPTTFYRLIRDNELLKEEINKKLRLSFAMQYANELWQADTLYGPTIKQPDGKWKKTFLIAFIDDASRVITHAEFFYRDNTANMVEAFRTALYKRGKPERLYFDNGANYRSKEILQACVRLNIRLSHAPVRDGAAKGKIERFFRGYRDRFLVENPDFTSLEELNQKTQQWVEEQYNSTYHSGIQMVPVERFNLDLNRVSHLTDDEFSEEVFFVEEDRTVSKTNVIAINSQRYECPVDLREKVVQVRYDRQRRDRYIVYFNDRRMGEATMLNLQYNAHRLRSPLLQQGGEA